MKTISPASRASNSKSLPIKKTGVSKTTSKAKKPSSSSSGTKKNAQEIILEIAAESHAMGKSFVSRKKLITGTGIAEKTITNNLSKLKQKGLIEYPDPKSIALTEAGIQEVGPLADRPTTNADWQQRLLQKLKGKQIRLFSLLADGHTHDKDDLAKLLGFEGGRSTKGFMNLIGAMRGQGILEYPDTGTVKLTEMCFLDQREE